MKRFWLVSFLLWFNLSWADHPSDTGIDVLFLNDYQQEQQLLLDGYIKYQLPPIVQDALHHEVRLTFRTQIELLDRMDYFGIPYNHNIKAIEYETILQYLTYNQTYYLVNKRNNQVQAFSNLKDALNTLGTLSSFYLINLSELYSHNHYFVRARSLLDRWQLPAPLILDSILDSDWQLDSGWQTLQIDNGSRQQ